MAEVADHSLKKDIQNVYINQLASQEVSGNGSGSTVRKDDSCDRTAWPSIHCIISCALT